jgi:hypothetical protein
LRRWAPPDVAGPARLAPRRASHAGNLGFFNPEFTVLVPGPDGSPSLAPRVLDLSSNKLDGPWPLWLLKDVSGGGVGVCVRVCV